MSANMHLDPALDTPGLMHRWDRSPPLQDPVHEHDPTLIDHVSLTGLHGRSDDDAVSDFAYATFRHGYRDELLDAILRQARALHQPRRDARFLSLNHLRHAHEAIDEVRQLMFDPQRLTYLSELAACRLEPYPIPTAGSHINFYAPGEKPIDFHTDGCAFVELIPLEITGVDPDTATVLSRDRSTRDFGRSREPSAQASIRICHELGQSVLLQGRSILHSADLHENGTRITLVLPLRSVDQPWKDDNTLFRLLQDDEPQDVIGPWVADIVERQLPAFRANQVANTMTGGHKR